MPDPFFSVVVTTFNRARIVGRCLERLMRATDVPADLGAIGYRFDDAPALVGGTIVQRRLLDNAPRSIDEEDLERVFRDAIGAANAATAGSAS